MQITERVRHIVAETLGVALSDVVADADFENDLGASLDYFQVFTACEEELAHLCTPRLLVAYIERKLRTEQSVWPPPPTWPDI